VYCCTWHHGGHAALPYCCAIQCLPRNLATHGVEQSGREGRGGKTWQRSTTVAQSCSSRFLSLNSFRMGLRHTAPFLRLFVLNSLMVCHLSFLPWLCLQHHVSVARLLPRQSFSIRYILASLLFWLTEVRTLCCLGSVSVVIKHSWIGCNDSVRCRIFTIAFMTYFYIAWKY
jgi:hypothetical protein